MVRGYLTHEQKQLAFRLRVRRCVGWCGSSVRTRWPCRRRIEVAADRQPACFGVEVVPLEPQSTVLEVRTGFRWLAGRFWWCRVGLGVSGRVEAGLVAGSGLLTVVSAGVGQVPGTLVSLMGPGVPGWCRGLF